MSFVFKTTLKNAADLSLVAFSFLIRIMRMGITYNDMSVRWLIGSLANSHMKEEET